MEKPKKLETIFLTVGLILSGLAIAITGVSYLLNMTFDYQWLVWIIGIAFIAVGILIIESPRGLNNPGDIPEGMLRRLLLLSMPVAFLISSQVCGLGFRACNLTCHLVNLVLIILAALTAYRLHRNQSISLIIPVMIVVGLIPHCSCLAPINTLWHNILGSRAPTCEMIPLSATLLAVLALRGVRPKLNTILITVLIVVMVFIIVGGLLFGFPWEGCVDHPGMHH
jgi:hypothetical protein